MRRNGHRIWGLCHEKSWGPRNGHVAWMRSVTYHLVSRKSYKFYSLFSCRSAAQSFRPPYFLLCPAIWIEAKALSCVHCCYNQKIGPGAACILGVHQSPLYLCLTDWEGMAVTDITIIVKAVAPPIGTATSVWGEFLDILILNILFIATLDEVRIVFSTFHVWGHGTLTRLSTSGQSAVHRQLGCRWTFHFWLPAT